MQLLDHAQRTSPQATIGRLHASFGVRDGRTVLASSHSAAPLKLKRTLPEPDESLLVIGMDVSPGLLDGDVHDWRLDLAPGARVRVCSQGAMRVHPARGTNGRGARQHLQATVGDGATLTWTPLPTIPFAGSVLAQEHEVALGTDATLVWCEAAMRGREEHGERDAFDSLATRLRVVDERGDLLHRASTRYEPARSSLAQLSALADDSTCWGTLHAVTTRDGDAGHAAAVTVATGIDCARVTVGVLDHGWCASILAPRMCDLVTACDALTACATEARADAIPSHHLP